LVGAAIGEKLGAIAETPAYLGRKAEAEVERSIYV
jgi:hypothetical protein